MSESTIHSVRISFGPGRKPLHAGDRRTTKKHGPQIRIPLVDRFGRYCVSGSRQLYEWASITGIDKSWHYLLTAEERGAL